MNVNYSKGEMIVKHESGHVDRYNRLDLEGIKYDLERDRSELDKNITALSDYINKIILSIGVL